MLTDMATPAQHRLAVEEYLEQERRAEVRSEYLDGETFAMAGASLAHNQIVGNLLVAIREQLRDRGCGVWATDLRVRVEATGLHAYPDVVAVCGEPRLVADDHLDTLIEPQLIVEVLSPSTEAWDRGGKFAHYRTVPSLDDYVLVAQDQLLVEHYARQSDDRWLLTTATSPDDELDLALGAKLLLARIYERVPGLSSALTPPFRPGS
jgi:Uma2 family endonuclease